MPTHYEIDENKDATIGDDHKDDDANVYLPVGVNITPGDTRFLKLVVPGIEPPLVFLKFTWSEGADAPDVEVKDPDNVAMLEESNDGESLEPQIEAVDDSSDISEDLSEGDDETELSEEIAEDEVEYYEVSKEGEEPEVVELMGDRERIDSMLEDLQQKYDNVKKVDKPKELESEDGDDEDTFKVDANIPGNPKEPSGWLQKGKDLIAIMAMDDESDADAIDRVSKEHPGYKAIKGAKKPEV